MTNFELKQQVNDLIVSFDNFNIKHFQKLAFYIYQLIELKEYDFIEDTINYLMRVKQWLKYDRHIAHFNILHAEFYIKLFLDINDNLFQSNHVGDGLYQRLLKVLVALNYIKEEDIK